MLLLFRLSTIHTVIADPSRIERIQVPADDPRLAPKSIDPNAKLVLPTQTTVAIAQIVAFKAQYQLTKGAGALIEEPANWRAACNYGKSFDELLEAHQADATDRAENHHHSK